jgi:hypothetical protein
MHALAAKTDAEHLPQRVAPLLLEHTQQVAQRRERYTEWQQEQQRRAAERDQQRRTAERRQSRSVERDDAGLEL